MRWSGIDHEAIHGCEGDNAGGADPLRTGKRQDFAGTADIHALAGFEDAAAEEVAPGIHSPNRDGHPPRMAAELHLAGNVGEEA